MHKVFYYYTENSPVSAPSDESSESEEYYSDYYYSDDYYTEYSDSEEETEVTLFIYDEPTETFIAVSEPSPFIQDYYALDEETGTFGLYTEEIHTYELYNYD